MSSIWANLCVLSDSTWLPLLGGGIKSKYIIITNFCEQYITTAQNLSRFILCMLKVAHSSAWEFLWHIVCIQSMQNIFVRCPLQQALPSCGVLLWPTFIEVFRLLWQCIKTCFSKLTKFAMLPPNCSKTATWFFLTYPIRNFTFFGTINLFSKVEPALLGRCLKETRAFAKSRLLPGPRQCLHAFSNLAWKNL